ncbi:hypothetical protein UB45_17045 [Terrabacter sp. 28]|nr:hypothetical protein UB45_17045 [Terrabacter sp. 28]
MSRLPDYESRSLWSELKKLITRVKSLENRSPFSGTGARPNGANGLQVDGDLIVDGNLNVSDVGRLSFPAGGSLLANDLAGRQYAYLGGLSTNGFGAILTRLNGQAALVFADDDALLEAVQRLRLFDSNGKPLITEDASGSGAAWPLAPIPFAGVSWPTWDNNATTTWTTVATALTYKSSARIYAVANHIADGTAAGEVRLLANSTQVGATATVANLAMGQATFGTPAALPGAVGDPITLELQARNTTGTGKTYARMTAAMQWPST